MVVGFRLRVEGLQRAGFEVEGLEFEIRVRAANPEPQTPNLKPWVLPPLSNNWIIFIISLCIALNMTPSIDCYWVGAVPNLNPELQPCGFGRRISDLGFGGFRVLGFRGLRVLVFRGFRVLGFRGFRVLGFRGFRVLGFRGFRVLGFRGLRVQVRV